MPTTKPWHDALFRNVDPLFLLEIYAYRNAIERLWSQSVADNNKRRRLWLTRSELNDVVCAAEFEQVRLCSAFELSLSTMCDETKLIDFIAYQSGRRLPETDQSLGTLRRWMHEHYQGHDLLNSDDYTRLCMAEELRRLACVHQLPAAVEQFGSLHTWTDDVFGEYFEQYPLEEIRLPLTEAIEHLRSQGNPLLWTLRECAIFGTMGSAPQRPYDPSVYEGESWEDTL